MTTEEKLEQALAKAAMLESALHKAFLKWEPHGGPHAAAEYCGNQSGPCVCDLQELEDLALSPSDVTRWLAEHDAQVREEGRRAGREDVYAEMCEHVGRIIEPGLVTEIRNALASPPAKRETP